MSAPGVSVLVLVLVSHDEERAEPERVLVVHEVTVIVVRTAGEVVSEVEKDVDSVLPVEVVKRVATGFVWQTDMAAATRTTVVVACREGGVRGGGV